MDNLRIVWFAEFMIIRNDIEIIKIFNQSCVWREYFTLNFLGCEILRCFPYNEGFLDTQPKKFEIKYFFHFSLNLNFVKKLYYIFNFISILTNF